MTRISKISTMLALIIGICAALCSSQVNASEPVPCSCWSSRWLLACCQERTVKQTAEECTAWCEKIKPGGYASTDQSSYDGCSLRLFPASMCE